jgi:hypothetical protein
MPVSHIPARVYFDLSQELSRTSGADISQI